jgi:hypothetical protein
MSLIEKPVTKWPFERDKMWYKKNIWILEKEVEKMGNRWKWIA